MIQYLYSVEKSVHTSSQTVYPIIANSSHNEFVLTRPTLYNDFSPDFYVSHGRIPPTSYATDVTFHAAGHPVV